MAQPHHAKTDHAFASIMAMVKIDIAKPEAAYEGT
jgi:hypothetical protein